MNRAAVLGMLVVLAACSAADKRDRESDLESQELELTNAEKVANILESLPTWPKTAVGLPDKVLFTEADLDEYELAGIKLQDYSSSEVRDGVILAMDNAAASSSHEREIVRANTFVVLRVLFDIPVKVAKTTVQVFSSYAAYYVFENAGSQYPLRWPVSFNSYNQVTDIARFNTVMGSEHPILEEYDWFTSSYMHRALPSCKGRCGSYDPSKPCQCDTACTYYQDCCVDYGYQCGTSGSSAAISPPAGGVGNGRPIPAGRGG